MAISDKAFIICVMLRSGLGKAQTLYPVSTHHDLLRLKQKMLTHRVPPPQCHPGEQVQPASFKCGSTSAIFLPNNLSLSDVPNKIQSSTSDPMPTMVCPQSLCPVLCAWFIWYPPPIPSPPRIDILIHK